MQSADARPAKFIVTVALSIDVEIADTGDDEDPTTRAILAAREDERYLAVLGLVSQCAGACANSGARVSYTPLCGVVDFEEV